MQRNRASTMFELWCEVILKLKEKDLDSLLFMGAQYLKKHKKGPLDSYFQIKKV